MNTVTKTSVEKKIKTLLAQYGFKKPLSINVNYGGVSVNSDCGTVDIISFDNEDDLPFTCSAHEVGEFELTHVKDFMIEFVSLYGKGTYGIDQKLYEEIVADCFTLWIRTLKTIERGGLIQFTTYQKQEDINLYYLIYTKVYGIHNIIKWKPTRTKSELFTVIIIAGK